MNTNPKLEPLYLDNTLEHVEIVYPGNSGLRVANLPGTNAVRIGLITRETSSSLGWMVRLIQNLLRPIRRIHRTILVKTSYKKVEYNQRRTNEQSRNR